MYLKLYFVTSNFHRDTGVGERMEKGTMPLHLQKDVLNDFVQGHTIIYIYFQTLKPLRSSNYIYISLTRLIKQITLHNINVLCIFIYIYILLTYQMFLTDNLQFTFSLRTPLFFRKTFVKNVVVSVSILLLLQVCNHVCGFVTMSTEKKKHI